MELSAFPALSSRRPARWLARGAPLPSSQRALRFRSGASFHRAEAMACHLHFTGPHRVVEVPDCSSMVLAIRATQLDVALHGAAGQIHPRHLVASPPHPSSERQPNTARTLT